MNSTSAADRGGRVARVDGGNVLLGAPGAPGCTTTDCAGLVCCARAVGKKIAETPVARNARTRNVRTETSFGVRLRRKGTCLQFGVRGKMVIRTRKQSFHETGNSSTEDEWTRIGEGLTVIRIAYKSAYLTCLARHSRFLIGQPVGSACMIQT